VKKESVKKNKFINLNFKILTEFIGSPTRFELTPAVGPLKRGCGVNVRQSLGEFEGARRHPEVGLKTPKNKDFGLSCQAPPNLDLLIYENKRVASAHGGH